MGHKTRNRDLRQARRAVTFAFLLVAALVAGALSASAVDPGDNPAVYTLDADFDQGTLVNVNHDVADQLQLDSVGTPFDFIWVAASGRGTIIKIDTNTGDILGEYESAPDGMGKNPSRTTVDNNGNVWAGNRAESSGDEGSVVHVGLLENGQCVDRNGNGVIDTSTGLGDIKSWLNAGGADSAGGVSTAEDECIIHYVRTSGTAVRTVAVDGSNNVWIGGYGNKVHELYDSNGTAVAGTQFNLGCGGYGGLVDGNGVLWSASLGNTLLRYDPVTSTETCLALGRNSYGLGIDSGGYVWNSNWTHNTILKIDPSGAPISLPFGTGGAGNDRGVTVTPDDNVWVANSGGTDVSRLDNAGGFITTVSVGSMPTGLAVDSNGKVWVTNYNSHNVMRIDPATDLVDLTVSLGDGAYPYNYSDMTGSTLIAPPNTGTWTVIYDSDVFDAPWSMVSWTADEPSDSFLLVKVASSANGVTFGPEVSVTNGGAPAVADGQYLKVIVTFHRDDGFGDSPVLYDLTLQHNRPPICDDAAPSIDYLWPPNHKFADVTVLGVVDPDGDPVMISVDGIFQDEPTDTFGDGSFVPDGTGIGTDTASVRAERSGNPNTPGNGRVYYISFTAADGIGGICEGVVEVGVPHDPLDIPIGEGPLFDSTM